LTKHPLQVDTAAAPRDLPGAGAPDLSITSEMIQAGEAAIEESLGCFPPHLIVSRVYSAMRALEPLLTSEVSPAE
jgi:hypothetical protein